MGSATGISPARSIRQALERRGADAAARCMQCATCSSVCDLSTPAGAFPRRQILWAQWGLVDRLAGDPSVWLCHQCNDCSARCPRDARPGDALQAIRALLVEELGVPRVMSKLVGRAAVTWPILLGAPVLFWALFIRAVNGFAIPDGPLVYSTVVPQWTLYVVFLPAGAFMVLASFLGARRAWAAWAGAGARRGSLLQGLVAVAGEILGHARFRTCTAAHPRQTGHLLLMWGFLGALATTTLLGIGIDLFGMQTPLPQLHPIKLLGNLSAILLAIGVVLLVLNRAGNPVTAGATRAFDLFLVALVVLLVASGIGAELGRLFLPAGVAVAVYVVHLGMVLALFLTFPYSKLAHVLYRTLAMAHERLSADRRTP